jgi:uncharacterized repeat protein (TIGR01451 family)
MAISVTDALAAMVYTESQSFDVAASFTGTVTFTLPATLAPGNYVVHGRVNTSGASVEAFADPLQVGLPGPPLDYQVTPIGVVRPNDILTYTLRFTNTIGMPLSNAVVTATLPVSVTVVPGSVTGGGIVESDQVRWALGAVTTDQTVEQSFTVRANADASPPGVEPGRLLSEPRLTADEIAPAWGPAAWNLVSLCGLLQGDVDCNCTVDATDLQILAASWRATRADPAYVPLYDIVPDEHINVVDVQRAAVNWMVSCP